MVKLKISQKDILLVIMDYLKDNNLLSSLVALEKESHVTQIDYGQQLSAFRRHILDGAWSDSEALLKTIFDDLHNSESAAAASVSPQ